MKPMPGTEIQYLSASLMATMRRASTPRRSRCSSRRGRASRPRGTARGWALRAISSRHATKTWASPPGRSRLSRVEEAPAAGPGLESKLLWRPYRKAHLRHRPAAVARGRAPQLRAAFRSGTTTTAQSPGETPSPNLIPTTAAQLTTLCVSRARRGHSRKAKMCLCGRCLRS